MLRSASSDGIKFVFLAKLPCASYICAPSGKGLFLQQGGLLIFLSSLCRRLLFSVCWSVGRGQAVLDCGGWMGEYERFKLNIRKKTKPEGTLLLFFERRLKPLPWELPIESLNPCVLVSEQGDSSLPCLHQTLQKSFCQDRSNVQGCPVL